jgi:hypothetical protein
LILEYYSDFLIISAATRLLISHCSLARKTGISEFAGYMGHPRIPPPWLGM